MVSESYNLVNIMFIIFTGASVIATLALFTKQTILVAYILLGFIVGPNCTGIISDPKLIDSISNIGIIFLLFLLGLNLHPQNLYRMLKDTALVTFISSMIFASIGFLIAYLFSFSLFEAFLIACCMIFSSTIIGLKLLPTLVLHQKKTGEIVISILLLQDLIAIALMLILNLISISPETVISIKSFGILFVKFIIVLPGLLFISFILEKYIIDKLYKKFDVIKEYVFLLTIGWCLGITEFAHYVGLSHEVGAFIAGIALATSPVGVYIAESLKPLRDFFLVIFFVALGASFNLFSFIEVIVPVTIIVVLMMVIKPWVFSKLLNLVIKTDKILSTEIGFRLGQFSEFSLLLIFVANSNFDLSSNVVTLIQSSTIISFMISSYLITIKYQTPLGYSKELRID